MSPAPGAPSLKGNSMRTPIRIPVRILYSAVLLVAAAAGAAPAAVPFCWTNQVQWSQEPLWPVTVSIQDGECNAMASVAVTSAAPFILCADLAPGEYQIRSELPENTPPAAYWDEYGTRVKVRTDGTLEILYEQVLRHLRKMTPLSPIHKDVVTDRRPTLKWAPFPGARSYEVHWFEEHPDRADDDKVIKTVQHLRTDQPEYTFAEDVVPGRIYEWSVRAFDADGVELAYWGASYFTTPPAAPPAEAVP